MAASVVGGAFLSAFVNVLFDRLSSPEVVNLIRGKKLDQKLIQRLETTLYAVQAVLNDAEQKQIKDPAVKKWLDDLKDAVYIADDLLDKVSTEAATQKQEVSNLFSRYLNLRDRKLVNEVEDITSRLEYIVSYKDKIGLKENVRGNFSWRTPSTSLVEESNIYGRVQDKKAIVEMLVDDNPEGKVSVIPIVGMGGVGKTTLAQWMFNDEDLMRMFNLKAWVCVSEEFDIVKVTKTIIEAITPGTCNTEDLNLLQLDLKKKLTGKKFFIVLDDIWNDDYDDWNNLRKPFQYGMKGSKILLTTREEKVASIVQTSQPYHVNQLSDEHCWSVFANHACFPESNGNSTLEEIGREIVKKCKGLPLAAQTLGGLLRARQDAKDWNNVLTSDIWEFSDNESKIIPALRLSYYHLPPNLKRCFAYCSLYPKDYEFNKDELILLWMAEELLVRPTKDKTVEEVGFECFDELSSRLFFKKCRPYSNSSFVMHDLMHDLAISVARDFYFRSEELGKADKMSIKTRHLSYGSLSHPISRNYGAIGKLKSLRTFLPINFSIHFNLESFACNILPMFKFLRVLSFQSFGQLDILPHSIGELIHLRYLNLSHTSIEILPESLCNLYNLQILKLFRCNKLIMLPHGMQNLVNLRHLDIRDTTLKRMPNGMSKLKDLQYLSGFVVGRDKENSIKELGELSNIHESIYISKLENVTDSNEALKARMMDKTHIKELSLGWTSDGDMIPNTLIERDILDKLQPHKGLRLLSIEGYRGTRFPDWIGHSSYYNMTRVCLESCENCCMLPSLGQLPSLKYLEIENFVGLETIGVEFYKIDNDHSSSATSFPSLEHLAFHGMSCWQAWHPFEFGAFPQLKKLEISDCPRLRGSLPSQLPALKSLRIDRCEELVSPLPRAPAICNLFISKSYKVGFQEPPLSLKSLRIGGCQVESMFQAMTISCPPCLQSLNISDCSSAISFPGGCLPESLVELGVLSCRKLEFPNDQQPKHESLKSLGIYNSCDSLTSFPLDKFPNLTNLEIRSCENLESLTVLQDAALQTLEFKDCLKLKSLPCDMNTLLPDLGYLSIGDCPEIESFPDGGLPSNLKHLNIRNCEKLLSGLSSIGVHEGLTSLSIYGACESVKSFPMEGLLPQLPSLTTLYLYGFSSLETLDSRGLLHLTSLEQLEIWDCPKLKNMAGERLPASLLQLEIYECPLLAERCQKKDVEIWPKISHIRGIEVQGRWIS